MMAEHPLFSQQGVIWMTAEEIVGREGGLLMMTVVVSSFADPTDLILLKTADQPRLDPTDQQNYLMMDGSRYSEDPIDRSRPTLGVDLVFSDPTGQSFRKLDDPFLDPTYLNRRTLDDPLCRSDPACLSHQKMVDRCSGVDQTGRNRLKQVYRCHFFVDPTDQNYLMMDFLWDPIG